MILTSYLVTLGVYFLIYIILVQGLDLQYGYTGILNFTYILFMAVGAYVAGVTSSGPPPAYSAEQYVLGWTLPFPIPLLLGGLVAGALGGVVGLVVFRRLRSDYLAIVTFALGFIAYDFVGNYTPLFDGFNGLMAVPHPGAGVLGLYTTAFDLYFLGLLCVFVVVLCFIARRLYRSPTGRTLRAIREDPVQAEALGKNIFKYRMFAMVAGCVYAGIGGALTVEYTGAINPTGWTSFETFVLFAALIVGGRANSLGVVFGVLVFPTILTEGTRLLPVLQSNPELVAELRYVFIGVALLVVMYLRPRGLIPERKYGLPRGMTAGQMVRAEATVAEPGL